MVTVLRCQDTNNDRITIEWTNTPDGAAKQFRREWFQVRPRVTVDRRLRYSLAFLSFYRTLLQGDGMVRRKNLPIEYNP